MSLVAAVPVSRYQPSWLTGSQIRGDVGGLTGRRGWWTEALWREKVIVKVAVPLPLAPVLAAGMGTLTPMSLES